MRFPDPSLVVLVGPSGSGKSTWAAERFAPGEIVSSDRLRAMAGTGEHDQDASSDAFELLGRLIEMRLRRRLTTVVDTLGLDTEQRRRWRAVAHSHGIPGWVVRFDTPEATCRERNRRRSRPVPAPVLTSQLRRFRQVGPPIDDESWDGIVDVRGPETRPASPVAPPREARPSGMTFALQVSRFPWEAAEMGDRLAAIAAAAEEAGFWELAVMDHFIQIPQVGRPWEDIPEAYTTLGYLAAATRRVRLGTLVTGIAYRNIGLVGKIVATLDVLSGGRAFCGLGAGWFEREHAAYGWSFPSAAERLDLLEDALQALPLMWGPGSPAFEGRRIRMAEAVCYPRPLQERVPIIVGGGGERRTLRLAALHADGCNLVGSPEVLARKLEVLRRHCLEVGRDPATIRITCLDTALVGRSRAEVAELVERLRPQGQSAARYAASVNAGTIDWQADRYRRLREMGVGAVFVALRDMDGPQPVERFAPVIEAVSRG